LQRPPRPGPEGQAEAPAGLPACVRFRERHGAGREMGPVGEPSLATTEQRVLRSTFASYAIQLARLGINFGARIALLHLILPTGHGVYELALRIVTLASAVRDLGLPYHLVRDPRRP